MLSNEATKVETTPSKTNNSPGLNEAKKASKRKAKGASRKGGDECPIFLRKTYLMVDTCNQEVASWSSDKETSFVVKNPERFASEIIPQYFKHSNFASFVRQLNFYGFRKIKSDPIKLTDEVNQIEAKYWYFRHDKFLKGRKDLLKDIRKAHQVPVQDQEDVYSLKSEVSALQEKILEMDKGMEKVSKMMLQMDVAQSDHTIRPQEAKVSSMSIMGPILEKDVLMTLSGDFIAPSFPVAQNVSALTDFSNVTDLDLLLEDGGADEEIEPDERRDIFKPLPNFSPSTPFLETTDHQMPFLSAVSTEMELEDSPLFTDLENDVVAMAIPNHNDVQKQTLISSTFSPAVVDETCSNGNSEDRNQDKIENSNFLQPLYDCLAVLPEHLQEQIVDGLAATVTNPRFFNDHIDAVSALAKMLTDVISSESNSDETKAHPNSADIDSKEVISPPDELDTLPNMDSDSDLTVTLVSTVMAAFITQHGLSVSCHERPTNANHTSVPIQV